MQLARAGVAAAMRLGLAATLAPMLVLLTSTAVTADPGNTTVAPLLRQPGGVAVNSVTKKVYVVEEEAGAVTAIDVASNSVVQIHVGSTARWERTISP